MARTAAEKKAAQERWKEGPGASDGPEFPWGLSLNLGKDELEKVGIAKLPEVGDEFTIIAIAKVTRVSQSASDKQTEDTKSVEFQITDLACEPGTEAAEEEEAEDDAGSSAAKKLYPKLAKG